MWHAVGTTTVLPSLKSAREFCKRSQPPVILYSGNIIDCYQHLQSLTGAAMPNDILSCSRGLPFSQNDHWTYYLIEDRNG
jgi:hypothetical protein